MLNSRLFSVAIYLHLLSFYLHCNVPTITASESRAKRSIWPKFLKGFEKKASDAWESIKDELDDVTIFGHDSKHCFHNSSLEKVVITYYFPRSLNEIVIHVNETKDFKGILNADYNVILIHGFGSDPDTFKKLIKAAQKLPNDVNIFTIDWRYAACKHFNDNPAALYQAARLNTKSVAKIVAKFSKALQEFGEIRPDQTIVVGHSLGAHIAGFAANEIKAWSPSKYQRIIGLDPAYPDFDDDSCDKRLCKDHATRVVVIHTNAQHFGLLDSVGHTDLYMNGGFLQIACKYKLFLMSQICSHSASIKYLTTLLLNRHCYYGQKLTTLPKNEQHCQEISSTESCDSEDDCVHLDNQVLDKDLPDGKFCVVTPSGNPYCKPASDDFFSLK